MKITESRLRTVFTIALAVAFLGSAGCNDDVVERGAGTLDLPIPNKVDYTKTAAKPGKTARPSSATP